MSHSIDPAALPGAGGAHPLTSVQQAVWLDQALHAASPIYNVGIAWRIDGAFDPELFGRALADVAARHDALRMVLSDDGGSASQRFLDEYIPEVPLLDLAGEAEADATAMDYMAKAFAQPFDLAAGPAWSAELVRSAPARHYWFQRYHHLVTDGFGIAIIVHAVADAYNRLLEGRDSAAVAPSYLEFAADDSAYFGSERYQRDRGFWQERYRHLPAPLASRAPALPGGGVAPSGLLGWTIPRARYQAYAEFAAGAGLTITHLMLAAIAAYYARTTDAGEIVIGVPVHNRGNARQKQTLGMFSSMSPIGVQPDHEAPLSALMREVAAEMRRCYRHQRFPITELNRHLRLSQHGRSQLFDVSLSSMSFDGDNHFGSATTTVIPLDHGHERTPLAIAIRDHHASADVLVEFVYSSAAYGAAEVARIIEGIGSLLDGALGDPALPLARLPLMKEEERRRILEDFNATALAYPAHEALQHPFELQAAATPEACAVVADDGQLTYAELDQRANNLAMQLRAIGLAPDDRVAICLERRLDLVVAVLAVLKAGAAYVPLDPTYPQERLAHMLADSAPRVVLAHGATRGSLPAAGIPVLLLDAEPLRSELAKGGHAAPPRVGDAGALAYVIYTSGSTGVPKGVMIEHRNARNFVAWAVQSFSAEDLAHTLFSTSLNFDLAVFEIFAPLACGGTVHVVQDVLSAGPRLQGITLINSVPSAVQGLLRAEGIPSSVRQVNLAGEPLKRALAESIFAGSRITALANLYGPTETTTYSTWVDMPREQGFVSDIGRPLANSQVYILDRLLQPVPVGIAGEIYIAGDGVARGYLNREQMTAERFVRDPFSTEPHARMYRTGDLGRWSATGAIEYLGRNDYQVKVRGFRIELGEIEARLAGCDGVREAVVMAREDAQGQQRLVAYFTAQGEVQPEPAALRAQLRRHLAEYMLPSAYVCLDSMPLTQNGKVDRKALPAPDLAAVAANAFVAPVGVIEAAIAAIWQELLDVERVGRHDHFFELGGHSLVAIQLLARLREQVGTDVSLRELFDNPTVEALARVASMARRSAQGQIPQVDRSVGVPLSFAQQRLWFLDRLDPAASVAYHMPAALRLTGKLSHAALQSALDRVVARHEILRTRFVDAGEHPLQRFAAPGVGFAMTDKDLSHLAREERRQQVAEIARAEARAPFDLSRGPLIRGQLLRTGAEEHILLLTMHHIVSDGWSTGILVREVSILYAAYLQIQPDPLPPMAIQYADYAAWQRGSFQGDALALQSAFWRDALGGAPELLALPLDRQRPSVQDHAGAHLKFALPVAVADGLRALGQRHGTTLFMTVLAGWAALLARVAGQDDIVIGTPVANRQRSETEGLIGFFVNMLALRVRMPGDQTVSSLLQQVKSASLAAFEHQDMPFEQVVEALRPNRSMAYSPLFQAVLSMNNLPPEGSLCLQGLEISGMEQFVSTTHYDLHLALTDIGGTVLCKIDYATALFDAQTIERLSAQLQVLLAAMARDEEQVISALPLLDDAQRDALRSFGDGGGAFDDAFTIHGRFEEQAAAHPDAIALTVDGQHMTYGELNAQANRMAHRLLELGVQADDRVVICAERGFGMIAGLLAIMKAGAGYVPLDPVYPDERLAFMLADCAPSAILADSALASRLDLDAAPLVLLDADHSGQPEYNPALAVSPSSLAYVIYTSGSTGLPKGVMIEHRNVARLMTATGHWFGFGPSDVWTLFHSFAFDFSVWEIWGALLTGGRLVVVPYLASRAPQEFYSLLCSEGVTVLNQTPSAFRQLVAAQGDGGAAHQLRCVVFGGEALDLPSLQPWYRRAQNAATRLINMYGITETTVHVTYRELFEADALAGSGSPIGRQIPDLSIRILDAHGQPVPVGVVGEIHVGGAGLARGYLNRPELTAARFINTPEGRLYKSGDLGRWLADGSIDYLGRNDFQVKIRGFRIELGEIEAKLAACDGVREAVVLAREDQPGDKRLVAYVVPKAGVTLEAATLRATLLADLADYMVPGAYVMLDEFPLTANGKLDRKALPAPDESALSRREYEEPQGILESALAAVWQELLGVERIGRHDHFFELGGHSLLAVQMLGRLRQSLRVEASLRELFAQPQLAAFAAVLRRSDEDTITLADRSKPVPLSFAQQRLWFLNQLDGAASAAYHMPAALRLRGKLDRQALQAALDAVVARHESLRTTFVMESSIAVQRFAPADCGFGLTEREMSRLQGHERELAVELAITDEASTPFDLAAGPLVRGCLLHLSETEHVLLVTQHHIVTDGWSIGVLVREVSALYAAFIQGQANPLPPLAIQYADYAAWQRGWLEGDALAQQTGFWKDYLSGAPALLELPTDRPRPATQSYEGASVHFAVPAELASSLRAMSQRHGTTLFMTMLAGWAALLARLSGQDDIVIGTPVANRRRAETEGLIGFFVNTLALRVRLGEGLDVASLLEQVKASTLEAFEHQDLPFEQVVEAVQPARSMAYSPLFQAMLSMNNTPASASLSLPGLDVEMLEQPGNTTQFDLHLALTENGDEIGARIDYSSALFERASIERIVGHFQVLLAALSSSADDAAAARLSIMDDAQRSQVLFGFNATEAAYDGTVLLHQMLEEQVVREPEAVAVVFDEQQVSYAELNARANRVAHHLIGMGVQANDRVAICAERSIEMVAGLFGILKAGAGYVPLDPSYPADRLAYMLADCAPKAVLVQGALAESLSCGATKVLLDRFAEGAEHNPDVALDANSLAYVIYTSGSTGQPKGVMNEHGAVANRLRWMQQEFALNAADCALQKTPFGFDVSVWEFFWPMLAGARLAIARPEGHKSPDYLRELVDSAGVTTLHFVPSMLQVFVDAAGDWQGTGLRQVFCSGEALPAQLRARFRQQFPQVALHNLYGPTEAAVDVTWFDCSEEAWPSIVPIGRPIANTSMYVLDAHGQPVPVGVAGELHIGGVQVARGYLNRPELTAERFVRDPFSAAANARMYKTGDLGRWLLDGNIEYLGRNDFQVKIRGFRIELGEIEAKLVGCEGIREAVVLAREDQPGEKRLVAYLLADGEIDQAALRGALLRELPEHMVPAAFFAMTEFPLNPNGKLDRKALPAPDASALNRREFEAPQGELESTLAAMWQELLGVERIGRHDHFFELGGHSLLAVQMLGRLRQSLHVEASLRELFAQPQLADFAAVLRRSDEDTITLADRSKPVPLSFAQQRLWFLNQLDGAASAAYHMPAALRLRGKLDRQALQAALDAVVARHESLRTFFTVEGGEPVQRFVPEQCGFAMAERSLAHLHGHEQELALEMAIADEASARFDLAAGPLVRGCLLRLSDDEHVLLITQHHIVTDGWSIGVLVREVSALYAAFIQGQANPLPPLAIQYADYAAWQRGWLEGDALAQQTAFWKERLSGAPALLELPTDRPRPATQSYEGASVHFAVPAELANSLRALSQRYGTTLFMTMLAGWAALLARLSGQDDIVIGTPVANRHRAETEGLIGFFVNTLALRVRLGEGQDVAALLEQVKASTLGAFEHQDLPFEQVVEAVQPARSMAYSPLFQAMLSMNNTPAPATLSLPGLDVEMLEQPGNTTQFDLHLALTENGDEIGARIDYSSALFERTSIERIVGHFQVLLAALSSSDGDATVARLSIMDNAQRSQVLFGFNATEAAYDGTVLLHQMLEEQVAREPEAVALVFGDQKVSYAELNARANRMAHHLIGMGVQANDRVAICAERSIEMVAGLFGILKAGAGYVPLDPSYPADRLAYMLADCEPKAVLVQGALAESLECEAPKVLLDRFAEGAEHNPDVALDANSLAYVIYTSGSTGQPKGVMNEHGAVANRLRWMQQEFALNAADCVLQKTPFGFDVSVWEFFWPMLAGARLAIARPEGHKSPDYLRELVDTAGVTTLHFVPSMLQVFVDAAGHWQGTGLRQVFCSGEALPAQLRARFRQQFPQVELHNLYGPTEAAVDVTWFDCTEEAWPNIVPIGRPIANTSMYVLDAHGQPVPVGVAGELHIGGVQVARGYLNRPELTAERFVRDPFSAAANARMYKTGDLGRWLPDGNIEYLGRNDFQVKIRGFRIELGEIEAKLVACEGIREAVVLAREDQPGDKRLVAYLLADGEIDQAALRGALLRELPEHMVPAAFVAMTEFPVNPNGKLDRKALPAPDASALSRREYEEPQGELESTLAAMWQELLGVERIGRHDHFFELGGHSLLVVRVIGELKQRGWQADVRSVFSNPTVASLAQVIQAAASAYSIDVPPAMIPAGCEEIEPAMLQMVRLEPEDISAIVARVPGGAGNVQDVYPLAPLQQGILFHHLLDGQGDTYLLRTILEFTSAASQDAFMAALQAVVARHDILRTSMAWQGLAQPVQVVQRHAQVPVRDVAVIDGEPAFNALVRSSNPLNVRLDLSQAPLVAAYRARDEDGRVYLALLSHHLIGDHVTMEAVVGEVMSLLEGREAGLPAPVQYRDFIAGLLAARQPDHAAYFRNLVGDVSEPCLPFGLQSVRVDGEPAGQHTVNLDAGTSIRIASAARAAGVTAAALFHLAWARVLAAVSGRTDTVFGTVLLGRMRAGDAAGALGMFINTLPVRLETGAGTSVADGVRQAFAQLSGLLQHEQASLTDAQRCAALPAGTPLFSSLLNYRHSTPATERVQALANHGIRLKASEEHLSYPVGVNVDDFGGSFAITAHCQGVAPSRVAAMLAHAIDALSIALLDAPDSALAEIPVIPPQELAQLTLAFNDTSRPYPAGSTVHAVFADVARRFADSVALVEGESRITYQELDQRANRVAQRLLALGVQPDDRVAIHAERSAAMVAGLLGILKAGAAYLPIDPAYPQERIALMLADAMPKALLSLHGSVGSEGLPEIVLDEACLTEGPCGEPSSSAGPQSLAYVMYTSGSTGIPNGVTVEHRSVLRLAVNAGFAPLTEADCVAHCASPSFDASTWELWAPLLCGARVVLVAQEDLLRPERLDAVLAKGGVNAMWLTAGLFNEYVDALESAFGRLKYLLVGGDALDPRTIRRAQSKAVPPLHIINGYGPTETVTFACTYDIPALAPEARSVPIGRPIGNTQVYVLDAMGRPVPIGATGEIHIGGAGVARGYLGRPELTAARFVADPFSCEPGARLYRTGDMGRVCEDGLIECLGRIDTQVKIRGFRIETGEIEARLAACEGVREAVVLARGDGQEGKRLVAYVLSDVRASLAPQQLRQAVAAALPAYMVPAAFVVLDSFPLTANGKLDRNALPEPGAEAMALREYVAPQGAVERALAAIWSDMLGVAHVGRQDNFFELGGHSLMAIQLLDKARTAFQVEPALKDLFESPVLADLAARISTLQYEHFLGASQDELEQELGSLSESELLAILAAESGNK
ncbi:amino acid adenylation domain-containing protein [Duganella sp. CF458]|uniref:non-ribosomal peptide synthetase n=1 Tax=Duganella sp. CF458 TaxID=1884368 RepID=UPI0008E0A035|nr:non-ribosomal peptide synthetase [Duganella sp. CF458]SFH02542.1 amino acid adenylation domain-containing protein [Duganella sp. CF458]